MDTILQQVRDFADKAHGEQMRKFAPERYIVHPVRVMEICRQYTNDRSMLAAALLHDVLEDTPVNKQAISDFLHTIMDAGSAKRTVQFVQELTDQYTKANYPQWNRRKRKAMETVRLEATSAESQTIKYADIIDNSSEIVSQDADFAKVFLRECKALLQHITKGNKELHERAVETVDKCLRQLKSLQDNK